ncbi:MAG: hypothetical protein HZB38_09595 [Planctomycetes bacterium]|nr:hypothetical protein [Planctomycetota bacterium]
MNIEPNQGTHAAPASKAVSRRLLWLALSAISVIVVLWVGSGNLSAPWIQGDERIFIANNPDVTGAGRQDSLAARVAGIFGHWHEDLYQPIPIATYALEWALWGPQRVASMRLTDVVLHAVNALLLAAVLAAALRRGGVADRPAVIAAWAFSLLWALHPALATTFAADMGRTHLLAATFCLLSLQLHIRGWNTSRGGWHVAGLVVLLCAMLSKVVAGWFLALVAAGALWIGWRAAWRAWYVWTAAAMCVGFAALALVTTRESGILDDAQLSIFGDPITRSLVGLGYYVRNTLWPVGLATWYPPDPNTSWSNPIVPVMALATLGSLICAWRAARQQESAPIAVGVVWFWASILPVLGLIGARTAAAQDRYLYLPLMGLVIGAVALLTFLRQRTQIVVPIVLLLVAAMASEARRTATDARDMLVRAERVVSRDANDPRAREFAAMAVGFVRDYPELRPPGWTDQIAQERFLAALHAAAEAAEAGGAKDRYFRDKRDRAAFHRRLAWKMLENRDVARASEQAARAAECDPEAPMTLLTLARTAQARGDWRAELAAYQMLEPLIPDDARFKSVALTEYGDLLLTVFERPDLAMPRLRAAKATGKASTVAELKLARCEVMVGQGATGYQLARSVFQREPNNLEAALVVALYHARSEHWEDAARAYRVILEIEPTNYEALRGFHEVCFQLGRMREAMIAWQDAARRDPSVDGYESFFVWAAACAGDEHATEWIDGWMKKRPADRFGLLARSLMACRAGQFADAVEWAEKARHATPIPRANEFARADAALRFYLARGEFGSSALLVRAAVSLSAGDMATARQIASDFLHDHPEAPERSLANHLLELASSQPATAPNPENGEKR